MTQPTWQETLQEQVDESQRRLRGAGPSTMNWRGIMFKIHPDMKNAIDAAARKRDLSTSTYLRRVLAIVLVNETELPLRHWLDMCIPEVGAGQNGMTSRSHYNPDDGGVDTGDHMEGMCTHPGCDLVHWD